MANFNSKFISYFIFLLLWLGKINLATHCSHWLKTAVDQNAKTKQWHLFALFVREQKKINKLYTFHTQSKITMEM